MTAIPSFSIYSLVAPATFIFTVGLVFSFSVTRSPHWSIFVALLKSALFCLYFAILFDGTYTFKDDWTYLARGSILYTHGISVTNMFAHLPELFMQAGGKNFIYYLFNADSFRLFGEAYFAPVAINVALTFLAAACMARAAREGLGFTKPLMVGLFFFTALQPDITAWSTVMNAKDPLVLACTSIAVYAVSVAGGDRLVRAILLGLFAGTILLFTRFYVPLMLLVTLFITLMLSPYGRRTPMLWLVVPSSLIAMLYFLGPDGLASAHSRLDAAFVNPLYGIPRMLLTPIPFHTTPQYAFLNLPQLFHWLLLPAMLYGVFRVWRRATLTARFIVIYFAGMLLLYGIFETLQGPRHRVQLDGLIALFQFYGLVGLLAQIAPLHNKFSGLARSRQPSVIGT